LSDVFGAACNGCFCKVAGVVGLKVWGLLKAPIFLCGKAIGLKAWVLPEPKFLCGIALNLAGALALEGPAKPLAPPAGPLDIRFLKLIFNKTNSKINIFFFI